MTTETVETLPGPPTAQEQTLNVQGMGLLLGISTETARRWCVSGYLPAYRHGKRGPWRASKQDLDALVEKRKSIGAAQK